MAQRFASYNSTAKARASQERLMVLFVEMSSGDPVVEHVAQIIAGGRDR